MLAAEATVLRPILLSPLLIVTGGSTSERDTSGLLAWSFSKKSQP